MWDQAFGADLTKKRVYVVGIFHSIMHHFLKDHISSKFQKVQKGRDGSIEKRTITTI